MKKSVLAVLAALSLAACGGSEKNAVQPQAGSAPAANAEAAATDTLTSTTGRIMLTRVRSKTLKKPTI